MDREDYEKNSYRRISNDYNSYEGGHDRNYDRNYDEAYKMDYDYPYYERKLSGYYGKMPFEVRGDYARRRDYARRKDYARRRRDYGYDYAEGMDEHELKMWQKKLMDDMEEREKEYFKEDKVIKRAEDLGIKFENYDEDEFYTTVLMMFTDYKKVIGTSSMDTYINLAKEWLKDPDSALRYGEKLTAYHDYVIMGE